MAHCTKCGQSVSNEQFCTNCGTPIATPRQATDLSPLASPPSASNTSRPPHRTTKVVVIVAAAFALAVAGTFIVRKTQIAQSTKPTNGTSAAQAPTVSTPGSVAPSVVPAAPLSESTAIALVQQLYSDWSTGNQTAINSEVAPTFLNQFQVSFLQNQKISSVSSANNTATIKGTGYHVCGEQTFRKSNGGTQLESRCFDVSEESGKPMVIWTGDQETIRAFG